MSIPPDQLHKLALKLIEVFSYQGPRRYGFERYWPLAGPLESFLQQATTPLEEEVAKALQTALEAVLRATARNSFHIDADAVAAHLQAPAKEPRRRLARARRYRR